jgi:hypothetical protein
MASDLFADIDMTPAVLKNKGVPITVGLVMREPMEPPPGLSPAAAATIELPLGKPQLVLDENSEPLTEEWRLRFDLNVIADIEEAFGNIVEWSKALNAVDSGNYGAIRKTVALLVGRPELIVGTALFPERSDVYGAAIGAAWAIANGVDPTQAVEKIAAATDLLRTEIENKTAALDMLVAVDSPGTTGSEPGSS